MARKKVGGRVVHVLRKKELFLGYNINEDALRCERDKKKGQKTTESDGRGGKG